MKPCPISYEWFANEEPVYRTVIPEIYLDANAHMNMRYYLHIFDDAGEAFVQGFGLTPEFHREHGTGGFDLEHHIHYLREVRGEDTVAVYSRLVSCSAKRIHYLLFLLNETRHEVAALFECVNSFADLTARRTAFYPPGIHARIMARLVRDHARDWPPPVCGVMGA